MIEIDEEERATMEAARELFNRMAVMIHRARMQQRHQIGRGVTIREAAQLHDDMQARRVACCQIEKGDIFSAAYREDVHQLCLVLATDLLSVWRVLMSEIAGVRTYPRPRLKKPSVYDMRPDGRGWAWQART